MRKPDRRLLGWIWSTSRGLRLQAVLNALTGVVGVALDFSFIYASKWAIDIATGRAHSPLWWAAVLLAFLMSLQIARGYASRWIAAILGVRSQAILQMRLFTHLMNSQWMGRDRRHSGDVLNRLERDVYDVADTITETIPSALSVVVRLVGAFFFLCTMNVRVALLLLVVAPLFILLSRLYVRRMRTLTREIRDTDSRIQSVVQESIQYNMVLKTLERCGTMASRLGDMQHRLQGQVRRRTVFSSTSSALVSVGFGMGYLVAFVSCTYQLQNGLITYGMMAAFLQLVGQVQGPFREILRYVPAFVSCITASERLMELQDTPTEEQGEPLRMQSPCGVRLTDVTCAYAEEQKNVLQNFSYDFPPGSVTAVLGETGAGKTTLVRLILALVRPLQGRVELYDDASSVDVSPLTRTNLVYVPQGNTLLSGTIRDNLLLGNPHATDVQMQEVLHMACADFVTELPLGLDTPCGELGAGLSEGQAQRIAIARALLRTGSVLLLDEATSALDMETERQLLQNLRLQHGSRTVICVTHRLAVVEHCTQVLRLERLA
ncbi:MAG: ABC transporter ATP-binding protein [Bacteroidaceae bacterium]